MRDRLLSHEEQPILLERLSVRFQRFVLFLLGTGIRLDECRGIDPAKDLRLAERWVRVTGKLGKTRDVPIPGVLVPVIEAQLAEPQWDRQKRTEVTGRLWTQNPQRLRAVVAKACRERKNRSGAVVQTPIPHLSPHAFRHTFGWRWLQGGGDIYTLSKVLGHATVAVTEKHYAHLLKGDIMAKADKVDLGLGLPIPGQLAKVLAWKA